MSNRTIVGGTVYEVVGSSTSNLLLKCNGTARIQWGNKLVDLIKNGKIVSEKPPEQIFKISDESEIEKDGFYILTKDDSSQLLVRKDGETYDFKGSDLYISASTKQDIPVEQRKQAIENLGIYYNTLQEAEASGIQDGLVYIINTKQLFTVSGGVFEEFGATLEPDTDENITKNEEDDTVNSVNLESKTRSISTEATYNTQVIPRGLIAMHSGLEEIPEGWAICDGGTYEYNGVSTQTPNLVNRFIKAVSSTLDIGPVNNADLSEDNSLVLQAKHLPEHAHTILDQIEDKQTVITSILDESTVNTSEGYVSSKIEEVQAQEPTSIRIEPNYYSLVFIMKL